MHIFSIKNEDCETFAAKAKMRRNRD